CLAGGLIAATLGSWRVLHEDFLPLRPQVEIYREANRISAQSPAGIWFPLHPLVTLYTDHRYYNDEDGLYIRMQAGQAVGGQQPPRNMPSAMHAMAFRNGWTDWGIAKRMLPPVKHSTDLGNWTLWSGAVAPPPP